LNKLPKEKPQPKVEEKPVPELKDVGQKVTLENYKAELMKLKRFDQPVSIPPLSVTIKDIKIIKATEVKPDYVNELAASSKVPVEKLKGGFSYIQVDYSTSLNAEHDIKWDGLIKAVTDTGEQLDVSKDFLVNEPEHDSGLNGKTFHEGFVISSENIKKIDLTFGATRKTDNSEIMGTEHTATYSLE
jgi:hypothetical protein